MGKVSALPSLTALRALEARNNEFDLKIPEMEENKSLLIYDNLSIHIETTNEIHKKLYTKNVP